MKSTALRDLFADMANKQNKADADASTDAANADPESGAAKDPDAEPKEEDLTAGLSDEQRRAFELFAQGHNVFLTGPGGTGKSELIRRLFRSATQRGLVIQVTALTGCAALLLDSKGKTLHSWACVGLGQKPAAETASDILANHFKRQSWRRTQVLVVDEVSMMSRKLFDLLNHVGRVVRGHPRPFGGLQLLFSGDFFQLPPVGSADDPASTQFCFESDQWFATFPQAHHVELKTMFRQQDPVYASILNQLREGRLKRSANELLLRHVGRPRPADMQIEPTLLFPNRASVEQVNGGRMAALQGDVRTFALRRRTDLEVSKKEKKVRAQASDAAIQRELDALQANLRCDAYLQLKVGSQVMSIVNFVDEATKEVYICNGSQGIVTGFCPATGAPVVRFHGGSSAKSTEERGGKEHVMQPYVWLSDAIPGVGVSQIPLILSWALTIHKVQGATLDAAQVDVGHRIFEYGQTYVALSRVRSLDGLFMTAYDPARIRVHPTVKQFYATIRGSVA